MKVGCGQQRWATVDKGGAIANGGDGREGRVAITDVADRGGLQLRLTEKGCNCDQWRRDVDEDATTIDRRELAREFHATTAKRMGGHGYEEPHYVHAKHMYNLDRMKHRPLKMTLAVLSGFSFGVVVPLFAMYFQQKKTSSQ
ncbi:hypothetical protein ZIOFF_005536 [Zingiber officinale]|uniref:SLL1 protein n=1 Tax=Zingiber officinale TaxID=94328 RepID=A0A8J5M1N4_ZINOF|nr:hypothetical protein ZIOFF_005536 [Zingiber officinale]